MAKTNISIVIATRNRSSDLYTTLQQCESLTYSHQETVVIDDGSTDFTTDMIRKEFPWVRLIAHDRSAGYIPRRNEGAEIAQGEIIVSLDDDSHFLNEHALERVIDVFQRHQEVGAVAFDIYDPKRPPSAGNTPQPDRLCRCFIGCGYAVRRSTFSELGGFREFYVYGDEEREFCMRLMNRGQYIVKTDAVRVFHAKTPEERRTPITHIYAFRNQLCTCCLNEPWLRSIPHLILIIAKGAHFAVTHRLVLSYLRAFPSFVSVLSLIARFRRPLSRRTFRLYDILGKYEPSINGRPLDLVARELLV